MNRRNFLGLAAPAAAASAVGVSAAQAMVGGEPASWKPIKRGRLAECNNCGCEVNGYLVGDPREARWKGVCLECEATLKAEHVRRGIQSGYGLDYRKLQELPTLPTP